LDSDATFDILFPDREFSEGNEADVFPLNLLLSMSQRGSTESDEK
jgi:hypothetical protein